MQYRKSLVAAATAAAVLTSGVSVAQAQTPQVNKETTANQTTNKKNESSSSNGNKPTAKEIQDWIAVATALVGLLGTIAAFAQKYLRP
ncbi:hypothetical protein V6D40_00915 [Corynebacterium sp. Q4381]|uniref:hypothetical protein n=1 Tax=Corynebacterium sp. Marseille-Q4381 TaxID=3121597 RepID=UPI002FE57D9E